MGYSEAEFWRDVKYSNTLYEADRITLDQRNVQIKGYLAMFENVDKEKADMFRERLGVY